MRAGTAIVPRAHATEPCALSFAQEQIWLAERLEPTSAAYVVGSSAWLDGEASHAALEQALSEIVRRHEAMRTAYVEVNGEPRQQPTPANGVHAMRAVDLRGLAGMARPGEELDERTRTARALAKQSSRRGFDLERGRLWRWNLVRVADRRALFVTALHHLCTDGWTRGLFRAELKTLYAAFRQGVPSPLADVPLQYADFAAWQRRYLTGDVLDGLTSYWIRQLAGVPADTTLPGGHRSFRTSTRGRRESIEFEPELVAGIRQLARRTRTSLFTVLLTAFMTVVYRFTHREDLVIGTPVANRGKRELEHTMGFFVNVLALRARVDPELPFDAFLRHVYEVAIDAYDHQDMPFDKLVSMLRLARMEGRNPIFQIFFGLNNVSTRPVTLPGVTVTPQAVDNESTKFDLEMSIREMGDTLRVYAIYKTRYFEAAHIRRVLDAFHGCTAHAVADASRRVADIAFGQPAPAVAASQPLPTFTFARDVRR